MTLAHWSHLCWWHNLCVISTDVAICLSCFKRMPELLLYILVNKDKDGKRWLCLWNMSITYSIYVGSSQRSNVISVNQDLLHRWFYHCIEYGTTYTWQLTTT